MWRDFQGYNFYEKRLWCCLVSGFENKTSITFIFVYSAHRQKTVQELNRIITFIYIRFRIEDTQA